MMNIASSPSLFCIELYPELVLSSPKEALTQNNTFFNVILSETLRRGAAGPEVNRRAPQNDIYRFTLQPVTLKMNAGFSGFPFCDILIDIGG